MKVAKKAGEARGSKRVKLEGGCYCGLVRYQISGKPMGVVHCHCGMCRRSAGAPVVTWLLVKRDNFHWIRMQPVFFSSSSRAERSFCDRCGTSLTFQYKARRDAIDVTASSLDEPEQITPQSHVYTESQLDWMQMDDGLKRFKKDLGGK